MNVQEARAAWLADAGRFAKLGVSLPAVQMYMPEGIKGDFNIAMDAFPTLSTDPNTGIPAYLTTMIDPEVFNILFSPNKAAVILGEVRKGSWTDQTAMFPVVEHGGEVSSYGDFAENGHTTVNSNWPQRQAYLYQTMKEYGQLELERAGLARINWVSEIDAAAATILNKYSNLSYFYGVQGLQNYGLLNDPNLSASLTPAVKAYGGTAWIVGNAIKASANEIYDDIVALFSQLIAQSGGTISATDKIVLAMSPGSAVALTATNSFGVNVIDLLKKNYPTIRFETAVQYGVQSSSNPQGIAAGNMVQMLVESVEGQKTGYCSFNEKMRAFPIIQAVSSFKQKLVGGTWGAIIRQPFAIASMLGV